MRSALEQWEPWQWRTEATVRQKHVLRHETKQEKEEERNGVPLRDHRRIRRPSDTHTNEANNQSDLPTYHIQKTHTVAMPVPLPVCRYHCASPNAEKCRCVAHSKSSYSSRSCMKLLTASKASFSASWFTSRPLPSILSLPTLTRPSDLDRPGRQVFAIRQRLFVELMDGHDDEMSLLWRRTVRALRTFKKMLRQHGQQVDLAA